VHSNDKHLFPTNTFHQIAQQANEQPKTAQATSRELCGNCVKARFVSYCSAPEHWNQVRDNNLFEILDK
jgi:hypothetical protein